MFENTTKTPPQKHHKNATRTPPQKHNHKYLMTIFYDIHHFSRTLGDVWKHHHKTPPENITAKTPPQNTTTKTPAHHHKNITTTPPQKHHQKKHHQNTTTKHHRKNTTTKHHHKNTTTKTPPHHHKNTTKTQPQHHHHHHKNTSFQRPAHMKWRKDRSAMSKMPILPQFWASDAREMTKGLPPADAECPFYHSFERPTRPKWRKGCSARSRICILPQFWTSDTSEVTKGSPRTVKNLRFTTVLSVRHVRSDERVARRSEKFAFYHSFERPTRTKSGEGRSATSKICVLPQFWASDTHEVTRGLSNPQVRSLRPRQKKNIF